MSAVEPVTQLHEPAPGAKRPGGGPFRALASLYGSGVKAFFRRKRSSAYAGDADARRQEVAKLAVRVGSDVAGTRFRSLFVGKRRRQRMREQAAIRASRDVMETLGEMKGLAMKIAQLGSFMMELPEEAEQDLRTLQADAPPMSGDRIIDVLKDELGADVMQRFRHFEMTPLASASIGQVHRATLTDGREVVLKVQYPGIQEAVLADLAALDELTKVYALMGDFGPLLENVERTLRGELDYRAEAANQSHFARMYDGHPYVKVPHVIDELSSARVLASEFVQGRRLYDVLSDAQEQRDRYGEIIYRFAFGSILQGVFSGDPHPGNYLFLDDGRVCFLDFGFVERFNDPTLDASAVAAPLLAALRGDDEAIADGLKGLGLLPAKGKSNPMKLWDEVRPMLFGPIVDDVPVRIDSASISAAFRESMKVSSELNKMRKSTSLQPWIGMLMRYAGGTLAVIGKLESEANWHRVVRDLVVGAGPNTGIGEAWSGSQQPVRSQRLG